MMCFAWKRFSDAPELLKIFAALLAAKLLIIASLAFMEPQGAAMYWDDVPDVPRMLLALGYQWDSVHYVQLAAHGYPRTQGRTMLFSFMPVYPLLMRLLTPLARTPYLAGVIVSNLFSFGAVYAFYRFARLLASAEAALRSALLFALFPTCLVYGTVAYSEAPYLFFAIASLAYQWRRRYGPAAFFLTLAACTRSIGIVLTGVQLLLAAAHELRDPAATLPDVIRKLIWFALPVGALAGLFAYYYALTGDFLVLFHSGGYFGDVLRTPWHQFRDLTSGFFVFMNPDVPPWETAVTRYGFTLPMLALTLLLVRIDWRLALYGAVCMWVTLSITGSAAAASPRIMLASWVTFLVGTVRMPRWCVWVLGALFAAAGVWVMCRFQTAFFI